MMPDVVVIREERDRFGRVRRSRLRYAVEFDPDRGAYRSRLLPGSSLWPERRLSRVVALGGGTGLPVVLQGLRRYLPRECRITAVVTAADDGGSSGALRERYGVLPPGDIRNCLVALASGAPEVLAALQYRLDGAGGPEHPLGNLLLTALGKVAADEVAAIRLAAGLLGVEDVVLPSTTGRVHLVADLVNGRSVRGESAIPRSGSPLARLRLDPPDAQAGPGVLEAVRMADMVILGPGSLYTSILATQIIPGVAEMVAAMRGVRVFICNLMTEPGETDGYGVAAHLEALAAHGLHAEKLDYVIVNTTPVSPDILARYAAEGAEPVRPDFVPGAEPPFVIYADVMDSGPVVRHAANKLGPLLVDLAVGHPEPGVEEG
jgi:uncharacterized cofD-like protein